MPAPPTPVVLVLRALQLGDLLVAVPAIRGIRRALPDHRLVLAAPDRLRPIVDLIRGVDELLPVEGLGAAIPVAPGTVDVAVNLHGRGPESAALVDALAARRTVWHALPGEPGTPWVEDLHERVRWTRLIGAAGMAADPADVRLPAPAAPSRAPGSIVVHVGAAFGSRRWAAEWFAAVARALEGRGRVVLSGSAPERARAEAVAAAAGLPPERVLAGETDLAGFAALIAGASLVVTGDTGAGHLASAFGTPSVVLFGPVGPERWGPPPGPHAALTHAAVRVGDAFADAPDPALAAVTVDEVLGAAARVRRPHAT